MSQVLKTAPAVFAVHDTYQIMVPVSCECVMWVKVGNECYYDDSNGILRSAVSMHRISVPVDELDKSGKYTVCYRKMIERKPYFSQTSEIYEEEFNFYPVNGEKIIAYHIADAHNMIDAPVAAAKAFEKENGRLSFLILNGDVPDHSGKIENFDNIYEIVSQITGGEIPTVFSRGNHDTRGIYAENIAEYTPCENGNSYFTFRLGNIWGIALDCGEDKLDSHEEYGNTVCCHAFRKRETAFIEKVIKNASEEYEADGIKHKIVVAHVPFTRRMTAPFNIEEDTYTYWAKLLRENIKPEIMICGHTHEFSVDMPGCENDTFGQPCPVVVGSVPDFDSKGFAGAGFVFEKDKIAVTFNDKDKVIEKNIIQL